MSEEFEIMAKAVVRGKLSRREFLGRAATLGITATVAQNLLVGAVRAAGPTKGGTLKAGMVGGESTDSLDPATWASQVPLTFGRTWGETLVDVSPDGSIAMKLADQVSSSKDAKTWTFRIKKDVSFHDGRKLTPADVAATLERHSDAKSKSGALGLMRGIDTIKADGDSVVIGLKDGDADLPYILADYHLAIQPNGGKDDPAAGIGTGPYKISTNQPGVRHAGEKFSGYWNDDVGHASSVEVVVINDTTARTAALQGGQVNMINRVEPKIVDLVKHVPGVTIRTVAGRGHYLFVVHCDTAPFDNNDLRLALKYAVDRDEMVKKILNGYGSVGNDSPINTTYPLYTPVEQRSYDPEKAAFHYKKSGHSGSILLRTSEVAFPGAVDAAQLYQQSASKAGIRLDIKREPGDGYWSEVWNKQPFCASYWGGRPTQDLMYTTGYYSKADWNETRFFRDDFDKMLSQARSELDTEKRKKLYADMGSIVRNDGGAVIPMFNDYIDATGPNVEGWVDDPNYEMSGGSALIRCWMTS
ncbi:ABC transporter substrate-binding protein [Mesorhizobium sp. LjNodule214]|uniref:ABC transporter substrate-binding protein n=1 Tax=Mesorhizobium sp. LjNodule214 TaxID=3342252 RepID=UPI003ED015E9